MKKKIKILYFVDRLLRGGIQSLIVDIVNSIDDNFIIELLVLDDGNEYPLENEWKKKGIKINKLKGIWITGIPSFYKYSKSLNEFFKNNSNYDIVHMHGSSKNFLVLYYANKYGIKVRIAHSHNIDFQTKSKFKKKVGNVFKNALIKNSTDYFACSYEAAKWLFVDEEIVKKTYIYKNSVDLKTFKFSEEKRIRMRKQYNISPDCLVVGNVGRLSNQKNHMFLLDIFNEIVKINDNYKLILVGDGENYNTIKDKINNLKLQSKVILTGFKSDVENYLQIIDIFLMPSLYEGLPVVGVEAQSYGIPCYFSEHVITQEVNINENVHYISLSKSAKTWAEYILKCNNERKLNVQKIIDCGFSLEENIGKLEKKYIDLLSERNI